VDIWRRLLRTLAEVRLQDGAPFITNVPFSLVYPHLTLPTTPIQLAPGAGAQFNVTASVQLTATNNLTDTATIKATSLSDATKTSSAVLTTTAKRYIVDLPIVLR
jgi:hypothetical protein